MKQFLQIIGVSSLLLYSFNSFAETEPNNTVEQANTIILNESETGTMTAGDVDWYMVTIPDDGKLTVSVSCSGTLQVDYVQLYDKDKSTLLTSGSYGATGTASYANLSPGTYFIKIFHWTGEGSYIISNLFTQALYISDIEPNDIADNAQTLTVNSYSTGRLFYKNGTYFDNVDWYAVTIPDNGRIQIQVTCESTLQVDNIGLYDVNKTSLITNGSYGTTATVTSNNLLAGTYYVKIPRWTGYGSYTISNTFVVANLTNDVEPNNVISQAQFFGLNDSVTGQLHYQQAGIYDNDDWFSVTIPDDGALTFTVTCETTLQVNNLELFDSDTITKIIGGSYGGSANVSYPNLTAGTYYIHIPWYTGYGSYILKNQFTPASYNADNFNNDSIQVAQEILLNDSITGRLYYRKSNTYDNVDWFKVSIPDDGQLSFSILCESTLQVDNLQLFDKDAATLITSGSYGISATVSYPNLTPGTYYIRVPRWTGYGSYTLKNLFTPATYANDSISNNSVQSAQKISLNDSITGRLYYRNIKTFDTQDWYMVVLPKNGNIRFSLSTTNGLQVDNLRIFAKNKTTQLAGGSYGVTASVSLSKTYEDTLYLLVPHWTGYGSYILRTEFLPAPTAEFSLYQNLYDIATINTSKNADTYTWDFGDQTTSTNASAKHTYTTPGTFYIQLIAKNAAGEDTATQFIEILGIRDFTPHVGGNSGDVTISIFGGGFREDSKIWIEKNGIIYNPDTTMLVERGVLRGMFNLRGIPAGVFDVCVLLSNGTKLTKTASFTIEQGGKAEPWVSIVGRDRILFNRWQTYSVTYGNTGKVDATGVPLWILLPRGEGIDIDFSSLSMSLPETKDTVWKYMLDSLPIYMDIDMYEGKPFKGRLYPLFVPSIPAGETHTLKFRLKTPTNVEMYAWISPPYFQSPVNPDVASCIRWAQATALANGIIGILNEQLPGVACISSISQTLYGLKYGDPQPLTSHLWTISRSTFTCAAEFIGPLKAYKLSIAVIELGLDIYDNYNAENECRKPKPDPNNPNKEKDPPFNNKPVQNQKIRAVSSFDPNEMVGPKGFGDKNFVPKNIDYNYSIYFENKASATAPASEVIIIDTLDKTLFDLSSFNLKFVTFGDTTIAIPQGGYEFTTDIDLRPTLPSIVRISAHFDTITGIARWHYITLDTITFDINEDPYAGFLPPNTIAPQGEGIVGFTINLQPEIGEQTAISNKATIFFDANPPIVTNTYTNYIDENIPQSEIHTLYTSGSNSPIIPLFWNASDTESGVLSYSLYVNKNNEGNIAILGSTTRTEYEFIAEPGNSYTFTCIATDSVGNKEPLTKAFDLQVDVPSSIEEPIVKEQSVFVSPNPVKDKAYVVFTTTKKANVTISVATANGTIVYTKTLKKLSEGQHTEYIDMSSYKKGVYLIQIESEGQVRTKSIIKLDL